MFQSFSLNEQWDNGSKEKEADAKEYWNDYVDCNQNQNCIDSADKGDGFVDMNHW